MKRPRLQFTDMKHMRAATLRRLWHSVHAAETSCLLLEQWGIILTSNSMPVHAILALIALITGPNSTRLRLVQLCQLLMLLMPNCNHSHAINYTNHILQTGKSGGFG